MTQKTPKDQLHLYWERIRRIYGSYTSAQPSLLLLRTDISTTSIQVDKEWEDPLSQYRPHRSSTFHSGLQAMP